jgi:hypothetical protein
MLVDLANKSCFLEDILSRRIKVDGLEDNAQLPAQAFLAAAIEERLKAALAEFRAVEEALATTAN